MSSKQPKQIQIKFNGKPENSLTHTLSHKLGLIQGQKRTVLGFPKKIVITVHSPEYFRSKSATSKRLP